MELRLESVEGGGGEEKVVVVFIEPFFEEANKIQFEAGHVGAAEGGSDSLTGFAMGFARDGFAQSGFERFRRDETNSRENERGVEGFDAWKEAEDKGLPGNIIEGNWFIDHDPVLFFKGAVFFKKRIFRKQEITFNDLLCLLCAGGVKDGFQLFSADFRHGLSIADDLRKDDGGGFRGLLY